MTDFPFHSVSYVYMFCAFLSSFSLLSQVFTLPSTLLTPPPTTPPRGCLVFHIDTSFFLFFNFFFFLPSPFCPHQNRLLRTHWNGPQEPPSALSVSSRLFILSPTELLSRTLGFLLFFFLTFFPFFGVTFVKFRTFLEGPDQAFADWACASRGSGRIFFCGGLGAGGEKTRCLWRRQRPGGCGAALTLWFLRCRRFASPPRCNGALNQEDSFWSRALQDLQTCGQSEILRELEVGQPPTPTYLLCPK